MPSFTSSGRERESKIHRADAREIPMEVSQVIKMKRAVREFSDEPIPEEQLAQVINAGRRAQSAKNRQAWHFIVVRDRETLAELSQLGRFAKQLAGAAAAIVILTPDPAERWSIMF
ncbi:MAG: nitroreductase family protein, partial [Chloroflexi bacterium]|nr:nitroreductase family protein [Chloroflexota bacterium]